MEGVCVCVCVEGVCVCVCVCVCTCVCVCLCVCICVCVCLCLCVCVCERERERERVGLKRVRCVYNLFTRIILLFVFTILLRQNLSVHVQLQTESLCVYYASKAEEIVYIRLRTKSLAYKQNRLLFTLLLLQKLSVNFATEEKTEHV